MATLETGERHERLLDLLLAEVGAYGSAVDRDLVSRAFHFAAAAHEGQTRRSGSAVHRASRRSRAHLRRAPPRRADARRRAPPRRRRGHRDRHRGCPRRVRRRGSAPRRRRHQADADHVPEPRASGGRELPQDDRRDVRGRPRDPDQARGPAAQHAHDRVPRQAEADPEGEGNARGLCAARTSSRHPRDQVGARGPCVPDVAPAQVRGDQADGRGAPRRSRRPRCGSCRRSAPRAREGRRPRGDLRPREALLFDLRQDGEEGPRVQRDLRPHRDARDRRARRGGGDARLLRRARSHPFALEADAWPVQGLRRDAEVQRLPLAAHDGDRAGGTAARDSGADARDARDRRARSRGALGVQARRQDVRAAPTSNGRRGSSS